MTPVAILSPGYPDTPGGVTDHTARLVASWNSSGCETVVIGDRVRPPSEVIAQLAEEAVTALLVQYVPFLYGRRGLSAYPESLSLEARAKDIRVTTFVHEPWVPANRPKWWILSPLQRRQLRRLLQVSDEAVTAVPAWQKLLGDSVRLVYIGCVQPPIEPKCAETEQLEAPVVFSPFASGLNWEWISAAVAELNAGPGLVVVGADDSAMRNHPLVSKHYSTNWDCRGRLPAVDVLETLARAHLVFAPFVDGATGRRTSIAAALSVGARVLSSQGHLLDPAFDGPVTIAENVDDFVDRAKKLWAGKSNQEEMEERLRWFRENLDPKKLDNSLLRTVIGSAI